MSLLDAFDQIAALQVSVASLQDSVAVLQGSSASDSSRLDTIEAYELACKECGKTGELHPLYSCSNCGWPKLRDCVKVCRICSVRNLPQDSGDPNLKECDTCNIDYPLADYTNESTRCKFCDLIFSNYMYTDKYYLDF